MTIGTPQLSIPTIVSNSVTVSFTTVAGPSSCLLVSFHVLGGGSVAISGMTFNGITITGNIQNATGTNNGVGVWALQNPPVGTFNLVISGLNAGITLINVGMVQLFNVTQGALFSGRSGWSNKTNNTGNRGTTFVPTGGDAMFCFQTVTGEDFESAGSNTPCGTLLYSQQPMAGGIATGTDPIANAFYSLSSGGGTVTQTFTNATVTESDASCFNLIGIRKAPQTLRVATPQDHLLLVNSGD